MTETIEQSAPAPQGAGLNQIQRITNMFFAPSKTFEDLRRSTNWIAPWLVMIVFGVIFCTAVGSKIGWEQVQQNNMRMGPKAQRERLEQLPADQKAQQLKVGLAITKGISYGFSVLAVIWFAIVALVLWATFSFGFGKDLTFWQALAIIVYSSVPGITRAILATVVVMLGPDPENFFIQFPVGTNLAFYLNFEETPRFLFNLAAALDLFTIWTLVLTSIGFAVITKTKRSTSAMIIFGWWLVVTLAGAGLGAAFS